MDFIHCKRCAMVKPSGDFYASNKSKCKDCVKAESLESRWRRIDAVRAYDRQRGYRQAPEYLREYRAGHTDRYKANVALNNAVRDGKVTPEPCFICGEKAEAHHPDYSQPLDVVWLCPPHHKQAHAMARSAA